MGRACSQPASQPARKASARRTHTCGPRPPRRACQTTPHSQQRQQSYLWPQTLPSRPPRQALPVNSCRRTARPPGPASAARWHAARPARPAAPPPPLQSKPGAISQTSGGLAFKGSWAMAAINLWHNPFPQRMLVGEIRCPATHWQHKRCRTCPPPPAWPPWSWLQQSTAGVALRARQTQGVRASPKPPGW